MWQQVYTPLSHSYLSALLAALPILFFFCALMIFKCKGLNAAILTLVVSAAVCRFGFGMPAPNIFGAALYGVLSSLWTIGYIVLMAVWLYKLVVKSGKFEVIRGSIATISEDQRIQVILIAFCFGAFLEGVAGFGVPIAICSALLVELGFKPLKAAMLCLLANAAAGAYGAIGIPIVVGAQQGRVALHEMSLMMIVIIQLSTLFIPTLLLLVLDGVRGVKQTWPVLLLVGVLFSGVQTLTLYFIGPELADIIAPLVSMGALALFMRCWQPTHIYREPGTPNFVNHHWPLMDVLRAWSPFYILTTVISIWSLPPFKALFVQQGALAASAWKWQIPFLHLQVIELPPIAAVVRVLPAVWNVDVITTPGTAIFVAVLITIWFSPTLSMRTAFAQLRICISELGRPMVMISSLMAVAYMANFSGASSTIGLMLAESGGVFPLISPAIGWVGVFLTGSVVNSNTLFAHLQTVTAAQISVSPSLLVAGNTCGGVMAKLISPQSIAIAAAAVGQSGAESAIMHMTLKYSLILLLYVCLWTFALSFFV